MVDNAIHIHINHAGFSKMKMLNHELKNSGFGADRSIFAYYFTGKMGFALKELNEVEFEQLKKACDGKIAAISQLTTENYRFTPLSVSEVSQIQQVLVSHDIPLNLIIETEGFFQIDFVNIDTDAQRSLKDGYQAFCRQYQVSNPSFLSVELFLNFISELNTYQNIDPMGWYLFGDLNLGQENFPHITSLFDQVVQACCKTSCSFLNLYPYSQNPQGCEEANLYLSGQRTVEYKDVNGRASGGFYLKVPTRGFAMDITKIVEHMRQISAQSDIINADRARIKNNTLPLYHLVVSDVKDKDEVTSPHKLFMVDKMKVRGVNPEETSMTYRLYDDRRLQRTDSREGIPSTSTVKDDHLEKPWYSEYFCCCLFSTLQKKTKPICQDSELRSTSQKPY